MTSGAEQVREHLAAGEEFHAAVWVSRAEENTTFELTRAAVSPFRFRRRQRDFPRTQEGLAFALEANVRLVSEPRILALTDRRVLVLARRFAKWRVRWECPRESLTGASEQDGRLRLIFGDGTATTLLTPAAHVKPFLDRV
ncbi:hypothetical protein ACTI_52550 [Actinoplanes sp. OR16]|uniref:hypothetical protein n=1 Tax=Actinoplanes sp. OR16 TaxID=946334 RepID=UPI000F6D0586|nr:hypothetical protein [Actinoplanes sp. OR16]BBH68570.1 hypothetical protein ACTI_52550 [Actinoplanes sp. OR16]